MSSIDKIVNEVVDKIIIECSTPFKEVKYFHPERKTMPNGCFYQRGGFLNECKNNKDSFVVNEGVHSEQYGLVNYRGGIIVFSTDVNAIQLDNNKLINKIKQLIITFNNRFNRYKKIHTTINKLNKKIDNPEERIGAYSVGNFFKGKYVGDNGEMYNEKSLSVEINGISSRNLLTFAELLAQEFRQETVLVKDLNRNKIYTADRIPMPADTTLDNELQNINQSC